VGVLGGVTVGVAGWQGWVWVAGLPGSIHINSTVLLFCHFVILSFFLFLFFFFLSFLIRSYVHMFISSCFQNVSDMNKVDSLRTMFHITALCRKRAMDFSGDEYA
jgi:hypothetical protein